MKNISEKVKRFTMGVTPWGAVFANPKGKYSIVLLKTRGGKEERYKWNDSKNEWCFTI